jgi:hypothetical protein
METPPHPQPNLMPTHPLLDPDLPPGWTPEHGPILILDNRPSDPHEHRCFSQPCQGRTWTCVAPRCYKPVVQGSCSVCRPPPQMTQTPTLLLRYVG